MKICNWLPEVAAKYYPPLENFTKEQFLNELISLKLLKDYPSFCKFNTLNLSEYATTKCRPEGWRDNEQAAYDSLFGVYTVLSS